jgi:3-oxoacyl-[acyl-carrier protein] reductase
VPGLTSGPTRGPWTRDTVRSIGRSGGTAVAIRAELGTEGDLSTLCTALAGALGGPRLDILVNNAAIGGQAGSIEHVTSEQFDRLFAVNVKAPLFIIQRALPLLAEDGRIINISSADTRIALPDELTYSMTKGAINVLSRTLADALGSRGSR